MSIKYIMKRDGSKVLFNRDKIKNAVLKAAAAVNLKDETIGEIVTQEVISYLEIFYKDKKDGIPEVEQVQDLVEKVLIEKGYAEVAKAYILYREQHSKIRDTRKLFNDAIESMNDYLHLDDWKVNENSNMSYSLQGLNNFVASEVTAQYWLQEIYPEEIRKKHKNGDFHIHDLGNLSVYCCGWDLQDLILTGFKGVATKIESKPPKHLKAALGQIVNFFYTLQGEAAGAMAFSNFDTYLAPFIAYDNLSYEEVKQAMQEFLFNMNVPTRVGFQCLSEDTQILTPDGWKKYDEVNQGDIIKTFNVEKNIIENKKVKKVFRRHYEGKMFNLKNRIQDQLISPGHRVVRKKFNTVNDYCLQEIEEINDNFKTPPIIPIAADNKNEEIDLLDEEIKLIAWIIAEGSLEVKGNWRRITIYQSKKRSPETYEEIIGILEVLGIDYIVQEGNESLGETVSQIRFNAENSRNILQWFDNDKDVKHIPRKIRKMSQRQSQIFLETYIRGDGHENCKITTSCPDILEALQQVIVNSGYGFTVGKRMSADVGNKLLYILRVIRHKDTYIQEINQVEYEGVIWSVNTDNETVIAKRNGKVFITGNTPFTNITMDLNVPDFMKNEPVIIGGEAQDKTYGDFQEELDIFNRVFAELMQEGDAKGRVFSFPIPTYNITEDFDWDNPVLDPVWEMTAKYGIPYFSNFVNSDMDPEDARSMCPISGEEKVLIKSNRGRGLEYSKIRNIYEGSRNHNQYEIFADGNFVKGKFNKFKNQNMLKVNLVNGHSLKMSTKHQNFVLKNNNDEVKVLSGNELQDGYYLPYSLKKYKGSGGNYDLGYFVGAFAGDGSYDGNNTVVFSLNKKDKKDLMRKLIKIAEDYFGAHHSLKEYSDTKLLSLKIHSKAAVGLCKDFINSKKRNKHYKARLYDRSIEFREGVIRGHYDSDGGNRNRIYTSSEKMLESLNMLAATLGTTTSVYKDERENRLGKEPNYSVLIYQLNRENYGDTWFKKEEKLWVKIDSIEEISESTAYCFEVENGEPMFTVGTTGILTHNCRLRLDNRQLRKRGGGLFGANPMTGSAGVVTLNMPRIGYLSENEDEFMERVYELMDLAKESLEIKREILENLTDQGLYPYAKFYLRSVKSRFDQYWKNHFNTIGLNGMNEALINFMGKNIASTEGRNFAIKVMKLMKERMVSYQEETDNLYNLEATPAEGTAYRLAKLDKERFGNDIIAANENKVKNEDTDPYYTNSTHLPVGYTDDIFTGLDLQEDLQKLYSGGTVFHGFLGEKMPGIESTKRLVKRIAENYSLPYYTITPTFSICPVHGYIRGEHEYCPKCKAEAEAAASAE